MEGREPMPACSGADPPSGVRLSESYFRCVEREWLPKSIGDPDFPNMIYAAGKAHGWKDCWPLYAMRSMRRG